MKDIRNMTDSEREQAYPPYKLLGWLILCVGGPLALFFSGEFIVTVYIGIRAMMLGWW